MLITPPASPTGKPTPSPAACSIGRDAAHGMETDAKALRAACHGHVKAIRARLPALASPAAHAELFARCTTRVRLRIMKRPAGFLV